MPGTLDPAPVILDIDDGEELLSVPSVIEKLTGRRPHPTTTSRYCLRGVSGVVLPSVMANGCRMTTLSAGKVWLRAVTEARNSR